MFSQMFKLGGRVDNNDLVLTDAKWPRFYLPISKEKIKTLKERERK